MSPEALAAPLFPGRQQIQFIVPGIPVPKQRARVFRNPKTGRVHGVTPTPTVNFEAKIAFFAQQAGVPHSGCDMGIVVSMYMPDRRPRDADNVLKAVKDALNGIAYRDDCQVVESHAFKFLDKTNPRTVVTLIALGSHVFSTPPKKAKR